MIRVPIDDIVVGRRYRRDLGDIDALAASIKAVGLLHPPVVVPDRQAYRLVAGERRLAALRQLGWAEVPVNVSNDITDTKGLLSAERDENTCRKDFAPSEAVALAKRIEELARPRAQANSAANLIHRRDPSAKVGQSEPVGRVADVAAEATGLSRETIRKATRVVDATTDVDPTVRAAAEAALAQMDTTGRVDPAYRAVAEAHDAAQAPAVADDETVVIDGHNWTPSRRRGLDVAHGAMPDPVRIGMGMWTDDGPPVVTSAAAAWLVGHGYLARVEVRPGQQWVELTPAGSDAWDRLHGLAAPEPGPEPEPARLARSAAERVAQAERLLAGGRTVAQIADELGVPRSTIESELAETLADERRAGARTSLRILAARATEAVVVAGSIDAAALDLDPDEAAVAVLGLDRAIEALTRIRNTIQAP